jgi:hypothetical protein
MEYCPHCRAMRRARKTTRTRQETRDGQEVTIRTHSYACAQCSRFLYSNEQVIPAAEQEPVAAGADEPAPAPPADAEPSET